MSEDYKKIYNTAPVGFYQATREGKILRANEGMARILGYSSVTEMLKTARMQDFYLNNQDREQLFAEYENSGGNIPDSIEICWKKKNGEAIWVLHHALTTTDDAGKVLFCEGSVIDITERKQAEFYNRIQHDLSILLGETSNLSEALNLVLDTVCDIRNIDCGGIYMWNHFENKLELRAHKNLSSQFVAGVRSYSSDTVNFQMVQKGLTIHFGFQELSVLNNPLYIAENLKCLLVVPIQYNHVTVSVLNLGSRSLNAVPTRTVQLAESIASQVGGTIRRINSENEVKDRQVELQILFDSFDDFMTIVNEDWSVIMTNRAGLSTLGYSEQEVSKMTILDFHPPYFREEAGRIIADMIEGRIKSCIMPMQTKSGEIIYFETTVLVSSRGRDKVIIGKSKRII